VCGPTIWNKLPQDLRSTDTREQFRRRVDPLSVRTAGGASDRHWLKARLTNGLTYLLTSWSHIHSVSVIFEWLNFINSNIHTSIVFCVCKDRQVRYFDEKWHNFGNEYQLCSWVPSCHIMGHTVTPPPSNSLPPSPSLSKILHSGGGLWLTHFVNERSQSRK